MDDQTRRFAALICNLNSQIKASSTPNLHHLFLADNQSQARHRSLRLVQLLMVDEYLDVILVCLSCFSKNKNIFDQ